MANKITDIYTTPGFVVNPNKKQIVKPVAIQNAAANTVTPTGYTVGAGYTPDTSLYADKTNKNAVAAQAYDNQLAAYQRALQSAYDAQAASNRAEAQKLKSQYDASRSDVYTNSRLSAIGNNERLAALGLAGSVYDYARSGTAETSRIGQDVAMRKSLAGLNQSENEAQGNLQLALLQAQKEAEANYANKVAEIEEAKIPYLQALARATSSGGGGGGSYSGGTTTKKTSNSGGGETGKVAKSVHNAAVEAASKNYTNNAHLAMMDAAAKEIARLGLSAADEEASLKHVANLIKKNQK